MKMEIKRIGIIGTGFTSRGISMAIDLEESMMLSKVLTRRDLSQAVDYPFPDMLTNSVQELIEHSDLIVEASGDVIYATEVLSAVLEAGLPVVTLNVELQLTTGTYLARKGLITEGEGDQPGSLAALHENVVQMGFKPLVYGNVKGFIDLNPKREDMMYWGEKQGLSLDMVTSFTDGTKVQFEQALVANGLGCGIAAEGLLGLPTDRIEDIADTLALAAKKQGYPISEYILSRKAPPGVFIIAEHDPRQKSYLQYFKMGDGPYYTIVVPFHMVHLEAMKTIRRVLNGGGVLLNNSLAPTVSVASIAKRELAPGERIYKGSGSFEFRGITVRIADHPNHVPIGLLRHAVLRRKVEAGAMLHWDDIDVPESLGIRAWFESIAGLMVSSVI
jgi:predicted homoserine dehydrogenase-like protein